METVGWIRRMAEQARAKEALYRGMAALFESNLRDLDDPDLQVSTPEPAEGERVPSPPAPLRRLKRTADATVESEGSPKVTLPSMPPGPFDPEPPMLFTEVEAQEHRALQPPSGSGPLHSDRRQPRGRGRGRVPPVESPPERADQWTPIPTASPPFLQLPPPEAFRFREHSSRVPGSPPMPPYREAGPPRNPHIPPPDPMECARAPVRVPTSTNEYDTIRLPKLEVRFAAITSILSFLNFASPVWT
ncbi:cleavage and polyadenylation specificity factor subunit 6-like [Cephus cinctus]|uniref:Cleavage and polyadenylation specificity factor subunit 6-like n=1 Tax=Cephus cinctus TaxID=211228 RepID=A0AAJ7BNL4_CEPCN|nr:cleavage and polyadenylation specificity factor subunit 6-like [Cephus cinctus]